MFGIELEIKVLIGRVLIYGLRRGVEQPLLELLLIETRWQESTESRRCLDVLVNSLTADTEGGGEIGFGFAGGGPILQFCGLVFCQ